MKKVCEFLLVAIMCLGLVACGKTPTTDTSNNTSTETSTSQPAQQTSYQSILDTYSAKIQAATPKLVEEYNNEAANNTNGMEGLAKISNDKITKLAEISNEGISFVCFPKSFDYANFDILWYSWLSLEKYSSQITGDKKSS